MSNYGVRRADGLAWPTETSPAVDDEGMPFHYDASELSADSLVLECGSIFDAVLCETGGNGVPDGVVVSSWLGDAQWLDVYEGVVESYRRWLAYGSESFRENYERRRA